MDNSRLIEPDKDSLSLSYDGMQLTLQASVQVDIGESGITFTQIPIDSGDLTFELRGWDNRLIQDVGMKKPFDCEESFPMNVGGWCKGTAVIFDGNNPEGDEVFFELNDLWKTEPSAARKRALELFQRDYMLPKSMYPKIRREEPRRLDFVIGEQFRIEGLCSRSTSDVLPLTSINFDRTVLELTRASVVLSEEGDSVLQWSLRSLQTGNTTVLVNAFNDKTKTIRLNPYYIVIKNDESLFGDVGHCFTLDGPPRTWLGFIDFGYSLIKIDHPTSQMLEVQATSINKSEIPHHALDLCNIKIICIVPKLGDKSEIRTMIQSTGQPSWGSVEYVVSPWTGNESIPWKQPLEIDIFESYQLLTKSKSGHFGGGIKACTSRYPPGAELDQPYYIYTLADSRIVGVGFNDRENRSFGMADLSLLPVVDSEWDGSALADACKTAQDGHRRDIQIQEHMKMGYIQAGTKDDVIRSPEELPFQPEGGEARPPTPESKKDVRKKSSSKSSEPKAAKNRGEKMAPKKGRKRRYSWLG